MSIDLNVFNGDEDRETSFVNFVFSHAGCGDMKQHRNPKTSEYTLGCGCGLEIRFARDSEAYKSIVFAVIDSNPRPLPHGSYSATQNDAVRVVPKKLT